MAVSGPPSASGDHIDKSETTHYQYLMHVEFVIITHTPVCIYNIYYIIKCFTRRNTCCDVVCRVFSKHINLGIILFLIIVR